MVSVNNSYVANYNVLASLRQINKEIADNQTRIATGLKVASAKDNASVFATAQGIRSDLKATDAIKSDLTIAKGRADVTAEALNKITDALTNIQQLLNEATAGDAGNASRNSQIKGYQAQIKALVSGASFKGANWLTSAAATTTTIKLGSDTSATMTFAPTQILTAAGTGGSLYSATAKSSAISMSLDTAATDLSDMKDTITAAIATVSNYANEMNGLSTSLTSQGDFLSKMDDIRKSALSDLVDADMTEESARSQALQVKQQLAYEALAIRNNSASSILRLFQ
ncbi:flagellin [Aureimonas leprariae]|uniref:Flagellin n=1 Tax=Plantimonas leprariae TaxID=2615207 RepID=A0A7V7TXE6_9HYPH|nr:flagellin [Aureimonas leprariae]KAB0681459.1 hypothetical protein F6X38_06135 [Aureimonas leprariae]